MMPATKAADCGVSSSYCRCSYRYGIAPSLYSIVQEMGRVDRKPVDSYIDGVTNLNRYEVQISFTCKLYARIMQHPEKIERDIQVKSMMDVVQLLVNPIECQHVTLEKYFENPDASKSYTPCENKCMWCVSAFLQCQVGFFGRN
jgi:hypothetical protein